MEQTRKTWKIRGGAKLHGTVTVHGNKNAALPAIASALLLPRIGDRLRLTHVPHIRDVNVMCDIVGAFGIRASWSGPEDLTLRRAKPFPRKLRLSPELVRRIRGSIVLLGPMAGLYRTSLLPKPGGDRIGGRPIGAHIDALAHLGISITDRRNVLVIARTGETADQVWLTEQSVTATLAILLHSPFLPGRRLTITGAACEPHIVTLCHILSAMGARISGAGSSTLKIIWPARRRAPARVLALDDDYMEAATYAVVAAVTKSNLNIRMRSTSAMVLVDRYLRWLGVRTALATDGHTWHIRCTRCPLRIAKRLTVIKAEPWPRLPTDVMSALIVLATQCTGVVKFIEYMYDDRFGFVQSLRDIGADIVLLPPHAIIVRGPTSLAGNEMFLRPDIRSGAAMLIASLAATGTTILHDRGAVIERGYQDLPETLATLGADIGSIPTPFD